MFYPAARQVPSPHFNQRPDPKEIRLLVLHNISLPPGEFGGNYIEQFFLGKLDSSQHPSFQSIANLRVSSHFFIRRDGEVIQFVDCEDRAWHAGVSSWEGVDNCNDFSIGIELEGTDELPFTKQQYDALTSLTKWIQKNNPLIASDNIVGHSDIAPGRKSDPGPCFDWQYFHSLLSQTNEN